MQRRRSQKIPFSYRLVTNPGLEAALKKEISSAFPRLQIAIGATRGTVDITDMRNPFSDMDSNTVDDFLSHTALNSRLARGIHMDFGHPFASKWESQAREGMRALPWKTFFRENMPTPEVSAKCVRSRLLVPKHVAKLVHEAFEEFRGKSRDSNLTSEIEVSGSAPGILARVQDDEMRLSIDAAGVLNNFGFDEFESESRLDITESIAAACVQNSLIPSLNDIASRTTIWDPLCGSGIFPFVVSHILAGIPPGSPVIDYPFRRFPFHNPIVFNEAVDGLRLRPHPKHKLLRVIGSDSSLEAVQTARSNLERFRASLPTSDNVSTIPFPVEIERLPDAYTPPGEGKMAILTALPAKGDTERKYKRFHQMVESLVIDQRLVSCVVATSKSNQFRKLSKFRWLTDLRIYDGRREVEVLRLVFP